MKMLSDSEKPRWIYRFDNFKNAFALLSEAIYMMRSRQISQLEQEGVIQRFEYTWELIWKVLKDYLEQEGVVFETITPANVIKEAVAANLIQNGEVWMDALDARNKMSHTYSFKKFDQIIIDIEKILSRIRKYKSENDKICRGIRR
jgi:nucleotidyltransferase substrate binding protein (TIGR01987 family)